jgi:peptidoglycan/LPS O-acetylase OafA/YrhL
MVKQKLQFVDALRGIAILLVILVHSSQRLGWVGRSKGIADLGQFGVQLFFVTSAYTLARSWINRGDAPRRVSSFYIRRFFRIAPLYYIGIAIYFAVACFQGTEAIYTPGNVVANLIFVHGFVPTPANNKIVPGGWSIGTEMAFYLVFPLLIVWAERMAARAWIVSGVVTASVGLVMADIVLGAWLTSNGVPAGNNTFFYLNFIVQLPVFLLGLLAYFCPIPAAGRGRMVAAAGFVLFGALAALLFSQGGDAGAIASSTIAGVAWFFLLNLARGMTRVPGWICSVGRVSYSMYVFHFLFAWSLAEALRPWLIQLPGFARVALMFGIASVCTYVVARISERAIERLGIALGERFLEYRSRRDAPLMAG